MGARALLVIIVALAALGLARPAFALSPDEIAVICNSLEPASVDLANFYVQSRGLPADRIIELTFPTGEQMGEERFDPDVILPVRKALIERNLRGKVKCLLTVYGVPLKVAPRRNKPDEQQELTSLQDQADQLNQHITRAITSLEAVVIKHDGTFKPTPATNLPQMLTRADVAMTRARQLLAGMRDAGSQDELQQAMINTIAQISGPAGIVRGTRPEALRNLTTRPATQPVSQPYTMFGELRDGVAAANSEVQLLLPRRYNAAARKRLRELAVTWLGDVETLGLVQSQITYLTPDAPRAFDSELSLLWFDQDLPRPMIAPPHRAWAANPLRFTSRQRSTTPALIVSRLDGPESGTGRDIVLACKAVEASGGLSGRFVIDSRGLTPKNDAKGRPDLMAEYDQRLRDLSALLGKHAKLQLVLDDAPDIIRPASKIENVSLYCGWYSLRNYVPAFKFTQGAVAFHVASYEMISLRDPAEKGWCRGLLTDGVAATIGPVDEPYLDAFPNPMEFFPLLLTGKYTVAEAYWLSTQAVSWKMVLIADPLYNPYRTKPALAIEDLPQPLKNFVEPPKALPTDEEHLPNQGF